MDYFCRERNYDVFTSNVTYVKEFLGILFQDGLSYSPINTARSAISAFQGVAKTDSLHERSIQISSYRC